mmetsp:Transcript_16168/g.38754  ORF Transcript_16168/g.38754 Transcript_16168/m.38754 type:complete len:205 (+) Transcript_16168:244-858(+)
MTGEFLGAGPNRHIVYVDLGAGGPDAGERVASRRRVPGVNVRTSAVISIVALGFEPVDSSGVPLALRIRKQVARGLGGPVDVVLVENLKLIKIEDPDVSSHHRDRNDSVVPGGARGREGGASHLPGLRQLGSILGGHNYAVGSGHLPPIVGGAEHDRRLPLALVLSNVNQAEESALTPKDLAAPRRYGAPLGYGEDGGGGAWAA